MTYNHIDLASAQITVWLEAKNQGRAGMQAVANVIKTRCAKRNLSAYQVVTQHWQFSPITDPNDPQKNVDPSPTDPTWIIAQQVTRDVFRGSLPDITMGSDMYYARSTGLQPPQVPSGWGDPSAYDFKTQIGDHYFFIETR